MSSTIDEGICIIVLCAYASRFYFYFYAMPLLGQAWRNGKWIKWYKNGQNKPERNL